MTKEKETTIYFADGTHADVFRHGHNEYSIYFDDTGSTIYGSYLDVAEAIERYKEKTIYANEENHPMTSVGTYINLWNTCGDYDVFIILNEAEPVENYNTIIEHNVEDICHNIMQNNDLSTEKKKALIETLFSAYTDYGVQIYIEKLKKGDDN